MGSWRLFGDQVPDVQPVVTRVPPPVIITCWLGAHQPLSARPAGADCAVVDEVRGTQWPTGCTLIVLTGGSSRRLGRDKATTHVGGRRPAYRQIELGPASISVWVIPVKV
jgi:hypothetical protein